MSDDQLVDMPAAKLQVAVAGVLEDSSPLAGDARFLADEVIRLRDAGRLSKTVARDVAMLIYQRHMHSMHTGDFQLTGPIRQLQQEVDRFMQERLPDVQVDPLQVRPRMLDIVG